MKVSLITVAWNNASVIETCLQSVANQSYGDIEYIVIDGNSSDGTQDKVKEYSHIVSHFISEPDMGSYDAMNKGVQLASGDVIGLINSDDMLAGDGVIGRVVDEFQKKDCDSIFGDVVYVEEEDLDKVVRYFPGKGFRPEKMKQGFMPPHPSFNVKRELYEKYGLYDTSFDICADFELMVRLFIKEGISYSYIPQTLVKMRTGGASTSGIKSNIKINQEMLRSLRLYVISSNYPLLYSRYLSKVFQLISRPS